MEAQQCDLLRVGGSGLLADGSLPCPVLPGSQVCQLDLLLQESSQGEEARATACPEAAHQGHV